MKHFLSAKLRCLEIYHILQRGITETHSADPRTIGFLLGVLQFAGGWFLLMPFARLVPPFVKLFAVLPSIFWALYFIVSGMCIVVASLLPDSHECGKRSCLTYRLYFALWSAGNWAFLTYSSVVTIIILRAEKQDVIIYGIAIAFYPVLLMAAIWKACRLFAMRRATETEDGDRRAHLQGLKEAARHNRRMFRAVSAQATLSQQAVDRTIEKRRVDRSTLGFGVDRRRAKS